MKRAMPGNALTLVCVHTFTAHPNASCAKCVDTTRNTPIARRTHEIDEVQHGMPAAAVSQPRTSGKNPFLQDPALHASEATVSSVSQVVAEIKPWL